MAGGIKGITVKIGGDTTELGRSLKEAETQAHGLQKELKGVNTLLKFDPGNVTLLKQKQDLLKKSIEETKKKQEALNEVLKKVDSGEIEMTEEEYRNLEREIALTNQKLKSLTEQQKKFGSVGVQQIVAYGEKIKDVGDKLQNAGQKMIPVTGAISAIGAMAVKTTADFDSSMSNVSAISGATGKDLQALRNKAREMGAQTKFSASESADAMSYMAMAGWKTKDMLNGVSGVMNLASASGEDLAKTSDILTDGLTAFGLSAKESGRMADVMAAASSNANTNVSLLGESYKYCASTAGAMGYSLEDVTESLGLMANAGVKGSQAGTSLKTAMINLAKPTNAMQQAMDKYGISITNSDGSMKSWNQVVDNLRSSLGGLSESEKTSAVATIFGKEATAGMLSVINAAPKDVEKLNTAINNSTGCAKNMADTMNNNLKGQLTILKSQLEELAISFGEMLMPMIRGVVSAIQGFVDKLNSMSNTQRTVILVIMAVVASIAPLLIAIGNLLGAIGQIMMFAPQISSVIGTIGGGLKGLWAVLSANPILIAIGVITALVAVLIHAYNHCETFRNTVNNAFTAVKDVVTNVVQAIVTFFTETIPTAFTTLKDAVTPILESIKSAFTVAFETIRNVVNTAVEAIKTILMVGFAIIMNILVPIINGYLTLFTTVFKGIRLIVTTVWNSIKSITTTVWNGITSFLRPVVNGIKSIITTVFNGIRSVVSTVTTTIKSIITTVWNGIKSITTSVWNAIKSAVSVPINAVKGIVSSAVTGIKSVVSSAWNGIKSVTKNAWNAIKTAITTPINLAKTAVSSAVRNIRSIVSGIFNGIKPKLHLSLPKVNVSGGKPPWGIAGKGTLPSFHVSWNKLGAIFKKPTIFDTRLGYQGVGEAGPEAIAPIDVLQNYIREAMSDRYNVVTQRLDQVITLMNNYYPDAIRAMDRPVVVGVDSVDNALSDKNSKIVRGW